MKISELDQSQELIRKFLEFSWEPKGFLLLAGKNGTGKTTIAETIYENARVIETIKYNPKYFYTQMDLSQKILKDSRKWGEATYLLEELAGTSLLVLDDLGTRTPSESFKDFLYAVIEKRERNRKEIGTILTTNLTADEMRVKFGDAIVSRVASGQVFRFDGPDRRFKRF